MRLKRMLALLTICVLLSGCSYLFPPEEAILAPPLIEPEEVTYRTMEAGTGDIEEKLDIYASFSPSLTASLAFEGQGGRISDICVKLGQEVKAGDLMIELNSESLRRQIRQQEIEVEKARASLENARRVDEKVSATYDTSAIEKAKVNLELEENALKLLEYEADKAYRQHAAQDVLNEWKNKIETQDLVVKKAKIDLLSAENAYTRWQEQQELIDPAEEADRAARVKQAELELTKVNNVLADLQGDLKNAQLFAPIDGVITYMMSGMEIGQNVEGYTTLFRISDPSQIRLTYSGDNAFSFAVGMEVTVQIGSDKYTGSVASDPQTIPTTEGKLVPEVVFIIDDMGTDKQVTMGDSARVSAVLRSRQDVIVLPKNCVNSFMGRKYVNLLIEGVKVERDIAIGIETSTQVEITEGLEEGDLVIMP